MVDCETESFVFRCFSTHMLKYCGLGSKCGKNGCTKPQHPLLHREGGADTPEHQNLNVSQPNDNPIEEPKEQRGARQKVVSVHTQDC